MARPAGIPPLTPPPGDDVTLDLELLPAIGPKGRGERLVVRAVDAGGEVEEKLFVLRETWEEG